MTNSPTTLPLTSTPVHRGAKADILRRVIADVAFVTQLGCPQIPGETSAQFARRIHDRLHGMAGDLYALCEELSSIIDRG